MSKNIKDFEVLRAGTFVDANGRNVVITEDDLTELAESFDPAKWKAPYVKGHPKDNDPAQGYPESFYVKGGKLIARTKQLFGEFKEQLKKGMFSKISLSIFDRNSPANPSPGKLYVRHIGFLGAVPPAVSGLANVELVGGDNDHFEIELSCNLDDEKSLTQRIKDILADLLPNPQEPQTNLPETKPNEVNNMPEELTIEQQLAKTQADLEAAQTKAKSLEMSLSESAKKAKDAEFVAFCDQMVSEGKLAPAMKESWVELASAFPHEEIEFSEGKSTLIQKAKDLLSTQSKILDFTEKSKQDKEPVATVNFSAPKDELVDQDRLVKLAEAEAYAKEHNVSLIEAAQAVGA